MTIKKKIERLELIIGQIISQNDVVYILNLMVRKLNELIDAVNEYEECGECFEDATISDNERRELVDSLKDQLIKDRRGD